MDIQAGLICIGLVILSGAILLFISMFDMHKKTYEEAIAEQRKMPAESLLLGRHNKVKNKDKKQKKQVKKAKEKHSKQESSKETTKTQLTVSKSNQSVQKENVHTHVNFVSPEAEILNSPAPAVGEEKKKKKKTKNENIKPILVNKEEPVVVNGKAAEQQAPVNHFIKTVPKDELRLKLSNKSEASNQQNAGSENPNSNHVNLKEKEKGKDKEKVKEKEKEKEKVKNKDKEKEKEKEKEKDKEKEKEKEKGKEKEKEKEKEKVKDKEKEKEKDKDKDKDKENDKSHVKSNQNDNKLQGEKANKVDSKPLGNSNKNAQNTNANNKSNKKEKAKLEQAPKTEAQEIIPEKSAPVVQAQNQQKKSQNNQNKEQQQQQPPPNSKDQKNKKNKKNELTSLQQISERDSINVQFLIPLIRKAELSRMEVQVLTDILLNKHADNQFADHSEWIEGRQDPVVKLKKQLAEKEKALSEEQESSLAFQNKLKELRSEYNAERTRFSQACRQYEETIMAKQNEIQNLHARNRRILDGNVSEKQALTQKLQQLQAQINDETMMIRKLQEENSQTHNALQQELVNQRQQMEMHVARVNEQHQESENNLKAQIHAHLQEMEQLTASFNAELQKNRRNEEEIRELREQHIQSQNKIKALESRASQLKETTTHSQELSRQIEELQRANKELEKRLNVSLKMEEEAKFEKIRLQNDIHTFTNKMSELQGELDKLSKEKEKLAAQAMSKVEIEKELMRFKEENQSLISQVATFTRIEKEAQQLREENENLAAQMTAFTERPAADGRENGDSMYNEEQKKNVNLDFINHENEARYKEILTSKLEAELNQKKLLIASLNSELSDCKSEVTRLSSELTFYKTEVSRLHEKLEAQRSKNNELRQKNWKAMEALATTEKSLEKKVKETEKLANERVLSAQAELQELTKEVLQRIFPQLNIDEKVYEKWLDKFEESAKLHLSELSSQQSSQVESQSNETDASEVINELENKNSQLQALVNHYKTVIYDTEGMLNKLQSHVEQEEIRWIQNLEKKDLEIASLKKDYDDLTERTNAQMQTKMTEAESELSDLKEELENAKRKTSELEEEVSKMEGQCKQLSEERDRLNAELNAEIDKMKDLNKEVVKLRSTVKIGQVSYEDEHKKRVELEEELEALKSRNNQGDSAHNASAEVLTSEEKPKSRKPKWPVSGWFRKKLTRKKITGNRRKSH